MTRTLLVSPDRPGAYPSIGDALAVVDTDAVTSVSPGTYDEALFVNNHAVTIVAAQGAGTVTDDASSAEYPRSRPTRVARGPGRARTANAPSCSWPSSRPWSTWRRCRSRCTC